MSVERALAALLAAPDDDDDARRALAAAYRTAGDPRAELIEVGVEIARLPRWHPRWPELLERRRALEDAHADAWRTELGVRELSVRFQCGVPAVAEGGVESVRAELPALVERAPIRRVDISLGGLDSDSATGAALCDLARVDALRGVSSLSFSEGSAPPDAFAALFEAQVLEGLMELSLGTDLCEPETAEALARAAAPPQLTKLALDGFMGGVGDGGLAALVRAPWFERIVDFRARGQALTDAGIADVARDASLLGRPLALEWLDLSGSGYSPNLLGPDALRALADAPWFPRLRSLSLSNVEVAAALPRVFARASALERASLVAVGMGWETLDFIASMPAWTGLVELNLSNNPLEDDGPEMLARASRLPDVLVLRACEIGGEGLRHLGGAPEVRALDLRYNDLEADDWEVALGEDRLPRTTALWTDARGWTAELVQNMRAHYPRCDLSGVPRAGGDR